MRRVMAVIAGWAAALSLLAAEAEEKKPAAKGGVQAENPFKQAKVGDWAKYRLQSEVGGRMMEAILTMTITAKDEKEVVISSAVEVAGEKQEEKNMKVALDKPYQALEAPPGGKVEKIAEGDENIRAGGKDYSCCWVQSLVTMEDDAMKMKGDVKIWTSSIVPLAGIVKMSNQTTFEMGEKKQEIASYLDSRKFISCGDGIKGLFSLLDANYRGDWVISEGREKMADGIGQGDTRDELGGSVGTDSAQPAAGGSDDLSGMELGEDLECAEDEELEVDELFDGGEGVSGGGGFGGFLWDGVLAWTA